MPDTISPSSEGQVDKLIRHIEVRLDLPRFRKQSLLIRALTHWSYVRDVMPTMGHNERFEFHGDQVLGRSFEKYYRDHIEGVSPSVPAGLLRPVALSNGFIGAYALESQILEVALFSSVFKRNLDLSPKGASARLVAADLFEALCYAIWRDQGFPKMHKYASRMLWEHAAKIPLAYLEETKKSKDMMIPIDGIGVVDVSIPAVDRRFARIGFPNVVLTHIVSAILPDGMVVYGKANSTEAAHSELFRKLRDGFSRTPSEQK